MEETRRKKSKFTLKKVKKMFVNIWKKIVGFFKSLKNKFMKLPEKTRYITYVWVVVVLLIFILILASNSNNKFLEDYSNLENDVKNATLDYVKSNEIYPTKDSRLNVSIEALKDYGFLYEDSIKDKSCQGFGRIYYDDEKEDYVVDAYINCKKYTTKGYSDYKN